MRRHPAERASASLAVPGREPRLDDRLERGEPARAAVAQVKGGQHPLDLGYERRLEPRLGEPELDGGDHDAGERRIGRTRLAPAREALPRLPEKILAPRREGKRREHRPAPVDDSDEAVFLADGDRPQTALQRV